MPGTDDYGQDVPYPKLSDQPNIEAALAALVNAVAPLSNMIFANANERAAAIPSPVSGMETYLIAEQRKEVCVGGVWQEIVRGTLGWANVSLASGYVPWDGNTVAPRVRRVGPIAYLEGRMMKTGGTNMPVLSGVLLGTVPLGYRPVGHYSEGAVSITGSGDGAPVGRLEVDPADGGIRVTTNKVTSFVGFSSWWFVA